MQERTGCPTCSIGWSFALWRQVPYGAARAVPPTSAGLWWPPRDGGDKAPVCSPGCGPCSARCCRGLQFAPCAAKLTAGNAPPNVAGLGQRVLIFTSSGRNWDLAREKGLSIPCTCIQLPAGMGTEQGLAVGAGVRAALAPHRGCCCYYFQGRGNMIY